MRPVAWLWRWLVRASPRTPAHAGVGVGGLTTLAMLLAPALAPSPAAASGTQESVFQDDAYLVYHSPATVNRTLATLQSLGVQRVRVTLKWSTVAPSPLSRRRPAHFNALDPAAYPRGVWSPYDRVVELAARHHIGVEFNLTPPGPLWAMRHDSPTARAADHWAPSPVEFFNFVYAAGVRYSGAYGTVPRVNVWSIWNEPNQPGWLAPQSRTFKGRQVPNSPRLYRLYANAAYAAFYFSKHLTVRDTILIGELAPEGYETPGFYTAITPMPFVRALYCLDRSYRPLRGAGAAALGCPTSGSPQAFAQANPGLFLITGFAHHPYCFLHAPWVSASDPNFAPLANLGRLERGLDRAFGAYGVPRQLPIYLTEYGYQTNPPDPYVIVSPQRQASYLNAADYLAWRDPRVRSVAQFLLYDAGPDSRYRPADFKYWDTFQTGLQFANGARKPAFASYQMPIWVPDTRSRSGRPIQVWGQLRPATHLGAQLASLQWRGAGGRYTTIARVATNRDGYLSVRITPRGSGRIRIAWRHAHGPLLYSRSVVVSRR